jgi:hypothetical protein
MSAELDIELLKQIGWWLDQLQVQERDLGQACTLIRRRWEHSVEQGFNAEDIRSAVDQVSQHDVEVFAVVTKLLLVIASEDYDLERYIRFIRWERPRHTPSTIELLEWAEEYHALTRLTIRYLAYARAELTRRLKGLQDKPSGTSSQRSAEEPSAGPPVELSSPPEQVQPPKASAMSLVPERSPDRGKPYGLELDEKTFTASRAGVEVNLARSRLGWNLLKALVIRSDGYWSVEELTDGWEQFGGRDKPEPGTVHDAMSRLRKVIKPLGLNIEHLAPGYKLSPLDPD